MMRYVLSTALFIAILPTAGQAAVKTETVKYKDGDVELQGHLAWDDSIKGKRPGVLVVHEWWGLNDYAKQRAEQLAEMGYVAFALDMYGKDKVTEHPRQAGEWAGMIRKNVKAWRKRAELGLEILRKNKHVDPNKLAAIGYCFGGATVMQLAYNGNDLKGVVSFHGSLPVAGEDDAKRIKSKILVCHGAQDGFIPEERIQKFRKTLDDADADWQMIYYAGARHSFTNPDADKRGIDGLRYDKDADQRSWQHMQMFFDEIFGES